MTNRFTDAAPIGKVKRTQDGYVTAYARAVRTGVQMYRASEVGLVGDHMVRVMRPEEEVFSKDSLQSFSHAPVTMGHPAEPVSADNWHDLAVGEVSTEAVRDGDFIALPLILKDAKAIKALDGGMRELSAGYTAEIEFVDNHPDYDAIQRNIRINHLAVVPKARAGAEARIGDSAENWGASPVTVEDKETMTVELKTVILGDKAVSVEAKDAETVAAILADHKTIVETKDETIGELKAKLADAEAKILDECAIDALVAARVELNTKREAVKAKFGDEAVKDASDAEIAGMFKVLDKAVAPSKAAQAIADGVQDAPDADKLIADAISKRFNKESK